MLAVLSVVPNQGAAADGRELDLHFINIPFTAALDILSAELDVTFTGDRSNRRRLRDLRLSGPAEDVIAQVMEKASMDAFAFNGQIHYAPIEERTVRLIPLEGGLTYARVRAALEAAGLVIPGYDITEVANGEALVLSGPVHYLAISEGVISALEPEPDVVEPEVRVRRAGILESDQPQISAVQTTTQ